MDTHTHTFHTHLPSHSLVSLAHLAKEHSYVKPELTEDNVIYIKGGRYGDVEATVLHVATFCLVKQLANILTRCYIPLHLLLHV